MAVTEGVVGDASSIFPTAIAHTGVPPEVERSDCNMCYTGNDMQHSRGGNCDVVRKLQVWLMKIA